MLADLKHAGLKMTPQRVAVVTCFADDDTHPTAQDLFDRLKAQFPKMSFATVYNTLDALTTAGLSSTLRLGNAARFDPNTEAHQHAVCDRCGEIRDVPASTVASSAPDAKGLRSLHRSAPKFSVRAVERIYRGLCSACQATAHA